MADNKDKEIELLLQQLREKKVRSGKLTEEFAAEEQRRAEQVATEKKEEEIKTEYTIPVSIPFEPDAAPARPDTGAFSLTESTESERDKSRSLRSLLSDTTGALDMKGMIPKNIERGFDAPEDEPEEQHVRKVEPHRHADPSAHPLFSTSVNERIPAKEVFDDAPAKYDVPAEMRLPDDAARRTAEGIINVKEKVDEEFREFFGDTVIIDRQPVSSKQNKQKKISDFVMGEDGEKGGPVFENEPVADVLDEYRSEEDTEPILADLTHRRLRSIIATAVSCAAAILLLVLNLGYHGGMEFAVNIAENRLLFCMLNAAAALVCFGVSYKQMGRGLLGLVSFNGNNDSLYSLAALAAVVEPLAAYFLETDPRAFIAAPVGVTAVLFASLGRSVFINKILVNFKTVSSGFERYAAYLPEDDSFHRRVVKGLEIDDPAVLIRRRTGFSDNFLKYSFSLDSNSSIFRVFASIMLILVLAGGVFTYLRTRNIAEAIASLCVYACISSTFVATIKSVAPLNHMQNGIARLGTVVPGYAAAEEICSANVVMLQGHEIFPKGSVMLHGIKTFDKERIDKAIIYAASVFIPYCETLSPIFRNVIQGKTEMLYKVDNVEYEDGLGFCCWVDKTRVILGSREMMEAHEISVPSFDYEIRYTKTRSRDAIYLAVGGTLYAMFVVSYTLTTEVEETIANLDREGMSAVILTNDFNITPKKIADIFGAPTSMFTVLRGAEARLVSESVRYAAHSPSVLNHIGSLASFTGGLFACRKLRAYLKVTNIVALVSMILGVAISLLLSLIGKSFDVSVLSVLGFQTAWLLLVWLLSLMGRY